MRRALVAGILVVLVLGMGAATVGFVLLNQPTHVEYTVVRGDTLFLIAKAHGVTVEELRAWNEIDGDLIEVGQVLRIHTEPTAAPEAAPKVPVAARPLRPRPEGTDRPELVMPPEKPCLDGPTLEGGGDEAMAASQGLGRAQIATAMSGFVSNVLPCMDGAAPSQALLLELTVACTGRVSEVRVLDEGDWPAEVSSCVSDVLRYAPFPAHDLPDGEVFQYPLRFTPG